MDSFRISFICVHKEMDNMMQLYDNLKKELEELLFNTLPNPLKCIELCSLIIIVKNVDKLEVTKLEETIINMVDLNKIDIIFILDLASMQNDIFKVIDRVSDKTYTIGKIFATIPVLIRTTNLKFQGITCRNNKLIFSMTGNKLEIFDIIRKTADTIVLAAYLLRIVLKKENQKSSILNNPQVVDKNVNIVSEDQKTSDSEFHISVQQAMTIITEIIIKNVIPSMEHHSIHIKNAFGRILAENIICHNKVPPLTKATKEGYAVIVPKEVNETEIKTSESSEMNPIILDSDTSRLVNKGECLPLGTTAVIPIENIISFCDDKGNEIKSTLHVVKYGENVKFAGTDIEINKVIIPEFTRISAKEVGLLTAYGCKKITVFKKLSIGVMSIGNKLQEPGQPLEPGHSYDSNRVILISLLKENYLNSFDYIDLGITIKNATLITQSIRVALKTVDLLVTTGGCSSDEDCLKNILKNHFNATFHIENIDMKPGKSTSFALCNYNGHSKMILCLPKNPASVFLTAYLFLLPLIKAIHFNMDEEQPIILAKVEQKLLLHSRPRYVWTALSWCEGETKPRAKVREEENSISNKLTDINDANAVLMLPSKSLERNMLEVPSFVSAILIKFPKKYDEMVNITNK